MINTRASNKALPSSSVHENYAKFQAIFTSGGRGKSLRPRSCYKMGNRPGDKAMIITLISQTHLCLYESV